MFKICRFLAGQLYDCFNEGVDRQVEHSGDQVHAGDPVKIREFPVQAALHLLQLGTLQPMQLLPIAFFCMFLWLLAGIQMFSAHKMIDRI